MVDYSPASGTSGAIQYYGACVPYYISKILKCPHSQAYVTQGVSDKKQCTCSYCQSLSLKSPLSAKQVGQLPVLTEQIRPRALAISLALM